MRRSIRIFATGDHHNTQMTSNGRSSGHWVPEYQLRFEQELLWS